MKKNYAYTAAVALIVCAAVIGCKGCKKQPVDSAFTTPDSLPDSVLYDFTDSCIENGKKQWEVQARIGNVWMSNIGGQEKRWVHLDGVKLIVYQASGSQAEVTANEAVFNDIDRSVTARGNVVVTTEDGTRIMTSTLSMDRARDMLVTKDPVQISRPDGSWIRGIGLESDYKAEVYTIFQVTGQSRSGI